MEASQRAPVTAAKQTGAGPQHPGPLLLPPRLQAKTKQQLGRPAQQRQFSQQRTAQRRLPPRQRTVWR